MRTKKTDEIKNAGLKVTLPRMRILDLFQRRSQTPGAERHLSAEDVFRALDDQGVEIGLATVYRVLSQFEQAGILVRRDFDKDRATYELEDNGHHDHVVCLSCNEVIEFIDVDIEDAQHRVAQRYGYELCDHSMVLYGLCQRCQQKKKSKEELRAAQAAAKGRDE